MTEVTTSAIIYRIFKYSDKSAIALALSPQYGKFKLFMPRAYSRKSGFMTFVPGTLTFLIKEHSDLHKFISFTHEPSFYHYIQTPDIIIRCTFCLIFLIICMKLGRVAGCFGRFV
jgi:DNA repair protein RecO (recombination protein O)